MPRVVLITRGKDLAGDSLPRGVEFYFEFLPAKIEESISILNFFPPNYEPWCFVLRASFDDGQIRSF
jgi:hypothetical protein